MKKFKALISFSHDDKMFDPHQEKPYEFENEELLKAWVAVGYIEEVEPVTTINLDGKEIAKTVLKEIKKAKKVKGE